MSGPQFATTQELHNGIPQHPTEPMYCIGVIKLQSRRGLHKIITTSESSKEETSKKHRFNISPTL